MIRMLIVDDEQFAVEGILRSNNWKELGIDEVLTAYHASVARQMMQDFQIDILICDIEMPDEDGLSLVRWVKEFSSSTQSLFLTCHSEFDYAKQAISLGSNDYLLKPVDGEELAKAVVRMLDAIKEKEEHIRYSQMYRKYASLWDKQKPRILEHFWQDLLSRKILSFGDSLERAIQDAGIDLHAEDQILPILISIEEWHKPLDTRGQEIMEYAIKKAAEEIWVNDHDGEVITDKTGVIFVLIRASEFMAGTAKKKPDWVEWNSIGEHFIRVCRDLFYCSVTCYVGHYVPIQELPGLCENLKNMERDNVTETQSVLRYTRKSISQAESAEIPDETSISEWAASMLNGNKELTIRLIHRMVDRLEATPNIRGKHLSCLHQDTLQIIYYFLQVQGISSNNIPEFSVWTSAKVQGLKQYKHWAENLVSAVMEAAFETGERDSVIQKSIRYIHQNIEEELSREHVAAYVGLNPAYLSRLFKKETGQNLIDFLIEAKMNRAKELLDTTGMTVSAIAQQVGYSNFSHFSKTFRKQFDVNPHEYRNVTKGAE